MLFPCRVCCERCGGFAHWLWYNDRRTGDPQTGPYVLAAVERVGCVSDRRWRPQRIQLFFVVGGAAVGRYSKSVMRHRSVGMGRGVWS